MYLGKIVESAPTKALFEDVAQGIAPCGSSASSE
jgi:hypothetical protein